jgi:hypothetical protein
LLQPDHAGGCKISAMVGPRCKSKGCSYQPGHAGDCNFSSSAIPRCKKTIGCGRLVAHTGDCGIHTIPGTPGTKGHSRVLYSQNPIFYEKIFPRHFVVIPRHAAGLGWTRARAVCVCFLIVTEALARPRVKEDV